MSTPTPLTPRRKPDYDTTLARIAGNIATGLVSGRTVSDLEQVEHAVAVAHIAVWIARAIVAEVKQHTEIAHAD